MSPVKTLKYLCAYFSNPKILSAFITSFIAASTVMANPQGGSVVSGNASISSSGNKTTIQQSSQQAILQWNSFNINKGETTQFVQPSTSSVALNRINPSQGASQIFGNLNANGQLILINAAGINFNSGATVNVAGLIASTSDITNANFLAHNYQFTIPSAYANATITNSGTIVAASYGLVALLGNKVVNNGMIQANMGSIIMGAGNTFTIDFNGDGLVNFSVGSAAAKANVTNNGSMIADGGQILVSAATASSVLDNVINIQGVAQTNSVAQQNGDIILSANGGVNVGGSVKAKGLINGSTGGTVLISGNQVTTTPGAVIDVSGDAEGGSITVSGKSLYLGGQMNTNGTGSYAVGGQMQFTSNAIEVTPLASLNANGTMNGGVINFNSADSAANAYMQLDWGSSVNAKSLGDSGVAGTISINTATANFIQSSVNASGYGTQTIGGNINVSANNINVVLGAQLATNGDFVGGNVMLQGEKSGSDAANIALDSFSQITAMATGSDAVVGGTINMNGTNTLLAGLVSTNGGVSDGGQIGIYGQNLYVLPGALIDASAKSFGGNVTIGGDLLNANSSSSANVVVGAFSDVSAAGTGNNSFGGIINVSANSVLISGELDVSGTPFPTVTVTSSGGMSFGGGGMCGFGGGNRPTYTTTVTNSGSFGGIIEVTGNNINVQGGYLNASGNAFGGQISLGYQGGTLSNNITVSAGSLLDVGAYGTANNPDAGLIQLLANNTTVNGVLNASGVANSGSMGGQIKILAANTVNLGSTAQALANGDTAGGEIMIGGDMNGAGSDPDALNVNVGPLSYIAASALTNGNGGEVDVWSQNNTNFSGVIVARGGSQGGNGGVVEVSGSGNVNYNGFVDVSAPNGTAGTVMYGSNDSMINTTPVVNNLSFINNLLLSLSRVQK